MTKAEAVISAAESQIGSPYVYGTWGQLCTVSLRKRYANYNPSQRAITYKRCPVLSDEQKTCAGCKYEGKLAFDCRGFTHWCLLKAGISITGDYVGRQWTDKNWDEKGEIYNMPNLVCCVFVKKSGKWTHTGLHIGDGCIIHCSGEVKYDTVSGGSCNWTHYGIPKGLYTPEEISKAHGGQKIMRILKFGMRGEDVRNMQNMLNQLSYDCGEADGVFGTKTLAAVKAFQEASGLTVDGIAGYNTLILLAAKAAVAEPDDPEEPDDQTEPTQSLTHEDIVRLKELMHACVEILNKVD